MILLTAKWMTAKVKSADEQFAVNKTNIEL